MLRLFVALPLPPEVRSALSAVQAELRESLPALKASWTRPETMHVTLRFLGDVAARRVPDLTASLTSAAAGFGAFELACERLGCFPDLRFPRIVWAWVHSVPEQLPALFERVVAASQPFAEGPEEHAFTGHVTLARTHRIRRPQAERIAELVQASVTRRFGHWQATELQLVRSELLPSGTHHSTLATIDLRRAL